MAKKISRSKTLNGLWQDVVNGKTPPADESVWFSNPLIAFLYAKYQKKERYSEELERLFYGNLQAIYSYSHWLVTNLEQPVPEHLHNYMLMKGLEDRVEDKEWLDLYFCLIGCPASEING